MVVARSALALIFSGNANRHAPTATPQSGWKLVHGDVFRAPAFSPMLLSVLAGTGVQVFAMAMSTMTFALLGFLSPANRGGLLTALLLLFVFMGSFAGYYAARLYKLFGGKAWKKNTILTATLFPSVVCVIFFTLDVMLWYQGASTAVPFSTMCALILLWFGISLPLVLVRPPPPSRCAPPPSLTPAHAHKSQNPPAIGRLARTSASRRRCSRCRCAPTSSRRPSQIRCGIRTRSSPSRWAASCRSAPCASSFSSSCLPSGSTR